MATSTLGSGTLVLAGTTSGTTTVTATAVAGTTTLTLPAATDTLVGKATTDTLTNKTLTGAVMNGTLGATTPSTGAFTTLTSTGASSFATSSGSVGIGTSSPTNPLHIVSNTVSQLNVAASSGNTNAQINIEPTGTGIAVIGPANPVAFAFRTNATEAMRLDASQNLLVGTTSQGTIGSSNGIGLYASGYVGVSSTGDSVFARRSSDGTVITFRRDTTSVGRIDVTTTATSYVTSSDYRLKNTITSMTGALAKVAALKPVTYKWNFDGSDGEGFIAHELAEVCPHAVTGEKDAVNEDGKPVHQGVDYGKITPLLTAALQEAIAKIELLEARLASLESK